MNTSKTFSLNIENIVKDKNITHMEAVLWYCQKEGIEPDIVVEFPEDEEEGVERDYIMERAVEYLHSK